MPFSSINKLHVLFRPQLTSSPANVNKASRLNFSTIFKNNCSL